MISTSKIKTVLIYAGYGSRASYYDDWQDAFIHSKLFQTKAFNAVYESDLELLAREIKKFDLIVLLHSINADNLIYAREVAGLLQERKGLLLSFIGNELSLPGAPIAPKIAYIKQIGADLIGTQLLQETGEYLYGDTGARVIALPHALNSRSFRPVIAHENRPIDIGVRSFKYPATFLGDNDRNHLLELFNSYQSDRHFHIDIDTNMRLTRDDWSYFLNKSRLTVSNEAGGHWVEKDDKTTIAIKNWLVEKGGVGKITIPSDSKLRRYVHKLPWGVRQWLIKFLSKGFIQHEALIGQNVDFEEVYEKFFKEKEFPPKFSGKCISSRHFDAAGTKTCQIMLEGQYNNILQANEHYIPIKSDFSDFTEAMKKASDIEFCKKMANQTFDYISAEHTYVKRLEQIDTAVRQL